LTILLKAAAVSVLILFRVTILKRERFKSGRIHKNSEVGMILEKKRTTRLNHERGRGLQEKVKDALATSWLFASPDSGVVRRQK
jgi:hypothetical protein